VKALTLQPGTQAVPGMVLAQDVRDRDGRITLFKGAVLGAEACAWLSRELRGPLHVVTIEEGDLHEQPAGERLAWAVAGEGVEVRELSGGAWPLHAKVRGVVHVDGQRLATVNGLDDLIVYLLPHLQIVLEGELLGRAKIVPFVTRQAHVEAAEAACAGASCVRVRPFVPAKVAAVVMESLEPPQLERFRRAFDEKLRFFGSELVQVLVAQATPQALAEALHQAVAGGAQVLTLAGSKPMDPLDPALQALELAGARLTKHGVPAHPGTLLWLAWLGAVPVIGMPSCGLFSKATMFDLVLPRLLSGEKLGRRELAAYGDGGLLSKDALWRFPPYRPGAQRGELSE
jgi:hypothetical protein